MGDSNISVQSSSLKNENTEVASNATLRMTEAQNYQDQSQDLSLPNIAQRDSKDEDVVTTTKPATKKKPESKKTITKPQTATNTRSAEDRTSSEEKKRKISEAIPLFDDDDE